MRPGSIVADSVLFPLILMVLYFNLCDFKSMPMKVLNYWRPTLIASLIFDTQVMIHLVKTKIVLSGSFQGYDITHELQRTQ
jgi:hypothetical protein